MTGPIPVPGPVEGRAVNKPFRVQIPDAFPFAWPRVAMATSPSALTWHLDPGGALCLFRASDNPDRPWDTVDALFERVWHWHDQAAKGWPDDPGDPDLARYFTRHAKYLITYDSDEHPTGRLVGLDMGDSDWRHVTESEENRQFRRRDNNLWWFGVDVGVLENPIWNWSTLLRALPDEAREEVRALGMNGSGVLLVHYERTLHRGTRTAAIALFVEPPEPVPAKHAGRTTAPPALHVNAEPTITTLQIADDSEHARSFRAGEDAKPLAGKHVAVVGCGAVGSFTAELLARSGVGKLTLVDGDRLLPGNCVRHLADRSHVPKRKVDAVRDVLVGRQLIEQDHITAMAEELTPQTAADLFLSADLVIDAAANATVTGLLRDLVDHMGRVNFIKIGLHREGGIVRVDRFGQGTRPDDARPAFIAAAEATGTGYREAGCGDPISPTPPSAVLHAAATATRFAVDYLRPANRRRLPDSQVEVLLPQPDSPWQTIGTACEPTEAPSLPAPMKHSRLSFLRFWDRRIPPS